jgi:hypothetical protein
MGKRRVIRDSVDGRFVAKEEAKRRPRETTTEAVEDRRQGRSIPVEEQEQPEPVE